MQGTVIVEGFSSPTLRGGELIPHDDDLDVIIAVDREQYETLPNAIAGIEAFLTERGFDVWGDFFGHRWVKVNDQTNVDVFVGLREGDYVSFFPGPRCALKIDEMYPPITVPLHGVNVPIPRNPFTYLATVYGDGWRKPDRRFNHAWDKSLFTDLA